MGKYVCTRVAAAVLLALVAVPVFKSLWSPVDWQSLVEARFGRPVAELDTATFSRPWRGEGGSLTRAAWVKWKDGELNLLGLPAYEVRDPREVVARAELLAQSEWWGWCRRAVKPEVEGWSMVHDHPGDTVVFRTHRIAVQDENLAVTTPDGPRYEFRYTPQGWEMRKVEVELWQGGRND